MKREPIRLGGIVLLNRLGSSMGDVLSSTAKKEIELKDASRGARQPGSGAHHGNRRHSHTQRGFIEAGSQADTRHGSPSVSRAHLEEQLRAGFAEVDQRLGINQNGGAA